MGTDLYITAPEKANWRLSPEDFAAHLAKRWRVDRLAWDPDPLSPTAVEFTLLECPGGRVDGCFQRDGITLVLEYFTQQDAGEIAAWFRSLIPPEQPLLILLDSGRGYSELKPANTAEEITRRFD